MLGVVYWGWRNGGVDGRGIRGDTRERNWRNAAGVGVVNGGIDEEREGNGKGFECRTEGWGREGMRRKNKVR